MRVGSDQVLDITKAHTGCQDAQDGQDANLMSLVSGYKVDTCDATYIFADMHFLYPVGDTKFN